MTVHSLSIARAERENDNTKISVEQLMELVLHHIREGKVGKSEQSKPAAAFVCIIIDEPDGTRELESYRCGLGRAEEVGYIELFKHIRVERWRG